MHLERAVHNKRARRRTFRAWPVPHAKGGPVTTQTVHTIRFSAVCDIDMTTRNVVTKSELHVHLHLCAGVATHSRASATQKAEDASQGADGDEAKERGGSDTKIK